MTRSTVFLALIAPLFLISNATAQQVAATAELPMAAPEDVGMSAEKLAKVKPALQKFIDDGKVAGAIAIVARRGKVVLFDSVGYADVDTKRPLEKDAVLRFYSMTKAMTSVGIMMLVEEGKIGLDDPMAKFVPEFKDAKVFVAMENKKMQTEDLVRAPTIRDLLRHTSGLTYGIFGSTPIDMSYMFRGVLSPNNDLQKMVEKAGSIPLLFQPGSRFNYSISTDVLGHIIERVSGQGLDEFLQARIFEPLDMKDTGFHVPADDVARFSSNHQPKEGGGVEVKEKSDDSPFLKVPKMLSGGGGTVSTARDYIRFCQMLLNGGELNGTRLLQEATVADMTKNHLPSSAYPISMGGIPREGIGFGLGFSVCVEQTDPGMPAGEYGWGGAASTHFWISPKDELAVVVLSQQMPFTLQLEIATKPLIYDAIVD